MTILFYLAAMVCALLDIVALVSLVVGCLTFIAMENWEPYRWYLIGAGIVGLIVFSPLANHFLRKALSASFM